MYISSHQTVDAIPSKSHTYHWSYECGIITWKLMILCECGIIIWKF